MVRFILHTDFDCDAKFMPYLPEFSVDVFCIKDFVRDYMLTYEINHIELYMSQNSSTHFEYQFDVYCEFDDGLLCDFWTERHLSKSFYRLHTSDSEVF